MIDTWPVLSLQPPLCIEQDTMWSELGVLYRLLEKYNSNVLIDTNVQLGGVASWMITKCLWDENFRYWGVCVNDTVLSPKIKDALKLAPKALLIRGLCTSTAIQDKITSMLENVHKPVILYCGSGDILKTFDTYYKRLRFGDVIVANNFPMFLRLGNFQPYMKNEKIKRVTDDYLQGTRLFVGEIQ